MGLPSTYDAVIINFDSTPTDQLTLAHVVSRLLNEEVSQLSGNRPPDTETAEDEAMAVTQRRRTAGARNNSNIISFFCDKKGHYKSDCLETLAWEKTKEKKAETAAAVFSGSDDEKT